MFLWGPWMDPPYIALCIATLVISGTSQMYLKSTFNKWSGVTNSSSLAGDQLRERLVRWVEFCGHSWGSDGHQLQGPARRPARSTDLAPQHLDRPSELGDRSVPS